MTYWKLFEAASDGSWRYTTSCYKRQTETLLSSLVTFLYCRSPRDRRLVGSGARISDIYSVPYMFSKERRLSIQHKRGALSITTYQIRFEQHEQNWKYQCSCRLYQDDSYASCSACFKFVSLCRYPSMHRGVYTILASAYACFSHGISRMLKECLIELLIDFERTPSVIKKTHKCQARHTSR